MRPRSGVWLGEKLFTKLKNADKATFYTSVEARTMLAPTSKSPEEREFVVESGASMHMLSKKKRFKLRWTGHFAKIQEPYCGGNGQWGIANKRGSTSIGSRSWSLRDSAITRRNACCSILWKTLRRPRIFLRVGQRSKTTVEQRGKTMFCETDNFVPLVVPGLSATPGSNSSSTSTLQDLSSTSLVQERSDELVPGNWSGSHPKNPKPKQKEEWQSRVGRPFARSSFMVGGVHR